MSHDDYEQDITVESITYDCKGMKVLVPRDEISERINTFLNREGPRILDYMANDDERIPDPVPFPDGTFNFYDRERQEGSLSEHVETDLRREIEELTGELVSLRADYVEADRDLAEAAKNKDVILDSYEQLQRENEGLRAKLGMQEFRSQIKDVSSADTLRNQPMMWGAVYEEKRKANSADSSANLHGWNLSGVAE